MRKGGQILLGGLVGGVGVCGQYLFGGRFWPSRGRMVVRARPWKFDEDVVSGPSQGLGMEELCLCRVVRGAVKMGDQVDDVGGFVNGEI